MSASTSAAQQQQQQQQRRRKSEAVCFLPGDHLRLDSGFFDHHAIFVSWTRYPSCGHVVHHSGKTLLGGTQTIQEEEVHNLDKCELVTRPIEGDVVVSRARSRLGQGGYNVLTRNCEHFCHWCLTGDDQSNQVIRGTSVIGGSLVSFVGAPQMGLGLIASGLKEQIRNDLKLCEFGHITTLELQHRLATTVIATGSAVVGGAAGGAGGAVVGATVGGAMVAAQAGALAGGVMGALVGVAAGVVAGQHLGAKAARQFLGDETAARIAGRFFFGGEDDDSNHTRGVEQAYETLGVSRHAPNEDVNRAFRRLARERHPDRPNGSHEEFLMLQTALEKIRHAREQEEAMQTCLFAAQSRRQEETASRGRLAIGTRVRADWKKYGSYCPGCILFANRDGSYDISYDHGGAEEYVAPSRIQPTNPANLGASTNNTHS